MNRHEIKEVRAQAYEYGDWTMAAACEIAMDRGGSAIELFREHPGTREELHAAGVDFERLGRQDTANAFVEKRYAEATPKQRAKARAT